MMEKVLSVTAILFLSVSLVSCGTQGKARRIRTEGVSSEVAFQRQKDYTPPTYVHKRSADTIKVVGADGREMYLMKAILDEDGNRVANEVLDAAVVTARFRHIAERGGLLKLEFQIIVPESMMDSKWQLLFQPTLFYSGDSLKLDKVLVTGKGFRKQQLRGYQQYQKFLDRIVNDSDHFIDLNGLELFLQRYIPQIYKFKSDTSYVSDEMFEGFMGVSETEAIDHYTRKGRLKHNEDLKSRKDEKFNRYVKTPIITEGIRLDTVMQTISGNYIYNYSQEMSVKGRERIRRVDIVLDGEIHEFDRKIMDISRTEPITFYISSLSAFVDGKDRYITKVVERRITSDVRYDIVFPLGSADIIPGFCDNENVLHAIRNDLKGFLASDIFALDSVVVSASASPEGSLSANASLSVRRAESVSVYFRDFIRQYSAEFGREAGVVMNIDGSQQRTLSPGLEKIPFHASSEPENWSMLNRLVEKDSRLSVTQKEDYFALSDISDLDLRESRMRREPWYGHFRDDLYPRLRMVEFRYHMHRKGMVKDTIHTTVIDSTYMEGVQAIRERDYERALVLLGPYQDFNSAVAFCALDKNHSALKILENEKESAVREYLLAIIYSRLGEDQKAVQAYLNSCRLDSHFFFRGNLDPEIAVLIKRYGLNSEVE